MYAMLYSNFIILGQNVYRKARKKLDYKLWNLHTEPHFVPRSIGKISFHNNYHQKCDSVFKFENNLLYEDRFLLTPMFVLQKIMVK